MGSSKKHKKESKKRKHRSRSKSVERSEKHRHHKRHHKDRKKEKHKRTDESDSEDDCIIIPPPPKVQRTSPPSYEDEDDDSEEPSPPVVSQAKKDSLSPPPPPRIRKSSPTPPPSATNDSSLSIAETNKLRAKLGLKPLEVSTPVPVASKSDEPSKPASELMGGTDMGEFVHKPADNIAQKVKVEKIKAKLAERKEKRLIESKLSNIKKLGDESDDDDVSKWVVRSRKIQVERELAEKKAKELDDMDAIFGIGELVEEDMRNEKKSLYTNKDLRGLRVEHDMNNFAEGREVILTLKDQGVLEKDDDVLVNVNMLDDEHYKKNIKNKKQNPYGYSALSEDDDDEMEDDTGKRVLTKYDEEIGGAKKSSFTIGMDESKRKELVRQKLQLNRKVESLNTPALRLAAEYYTEEEVSVKFKKPKKKVRKIRDRKSKMLKADDLLPEATNGESSVKTEEEEWLRDIGSRRRRKVHVKPDSDSMEAPLPPIISIKKEPEDDVMDIDDLPPPPEDISEIKVEADDNDLELALRKARKLKQREAFDKQNVEKVAEMILSDEMGYGAPGPGGTIVLNSTAEFCRTLGDIPTYGLSGNRDEDAQEILDFEREMKEAKSKKEEKTINRGGWNDVEMDDKPVDITPYEAPILDAEPDLGTGVAGALNLAISKGYLEKETTKRPSASRFAHLQAQNYSIEDKAHVEDEKFGRRERYMGPTCDFKEKDNYKPNVKLDYIDDDGHVLCAKEAFRYLSHKFHGKGPGKNKVEKRMKKNEQEVLMKQMSSTDTPLGTLSMLQQKQKETQSAYIVLSGSKHGQAPASISKTKL